MYKFLYATKNDLVRPRGEKKTKKKKRNLNYPERIHKYESLPRPIDSNLCLSSLQNSNQLSRPFFSFSFFNTHVYS